MDSLAARANDADKAVASGATEKIWLDAWYDPVAGLHSFSSGLCLENETLLVGDLSGFLKVFTGGKKQTAQDIKLHGVPTSVKGFYDDNKAANREACIAVACGSNVYVYYKSSPYFKFSLDPVKVSQFEQDVWEKLKSGTLEISRVCEILKEQSNLTERSMDLLALENDLDRLEKYIMDEISHDNYKSPIQTCVTCMEVLKKKDDGSVRSPGALVLGTESRKILILDPATKSITKTISLRSVPMFMTVAGSMDVEYRIVVACRDKRIYSIKNGDLIRSAIELESPMCGGLVRNGKDIIVGCMDKTVHSFHFKGRKNWTLYMPDMVTNISLFECERISSSGFFVALRNGQVRLYLDKTLMSTIESPGQIVTGLQFGRFNREGNSLIMLYTSGAIHVKMLRRTAKLDPSKAPTPGPPAEQDIPLAVPKKTKLYIDQTQRERESAVDMHRTFQHSLCKIRYVTATSYLRLFKNSGIANAQMYTSSNQSTGGEDQHDRINVMAQVNGIGPNFRLNVALENIGSLPVMGAMMVIRASKAHFHVENALVKLSALTPHVSQSYSISVFSLMPGSAGPPLEISIVRRESTLINALVEMPVVEALPM